MHAILLIGFSCQDFVFSVDDLPSKGEKYRARSLEVVGGGLSANAAVAIARLGGRAILVTYLGDDGTGRDILAELAAEGVDCSLSRRFAGARSPLSAIAVDKRGERMILNYADLSIPPDIAWLPERLPPGVCAVQGDSRWEPGSIHAFRLARGAGVPSVLDADRAVRSPDILTAPTHVAWSAQGLREMTGANDLSAAVAAESRRRGNWVAVTDGENGCWFARDGRVEHEPAFAVDVVDTLGAGDTFHGALTLALGQGMPERRAVRFASAAAALKCTRFGGRKGVPAQDEVERLVAGRN
ncbi:MAG TPA: PfkB family carbohydrate kinase [Beijerinckiaceae bacterium]|nr:PfkB family carbohydrate kinase [Beijerinckiaceae bacterium]